jgi:hypothetical protein
MTAAVIAAIAASSQMRLPLPPSVADAGATGTCVLGLAAGAGGPDGPGAWRRARRRCLGLGAAGLALVSVDCGDLDVLVLRALLEDCEVLCRRLTGLEPDAVGTLSTYSLGAALPDSVGVDVVGVEVVGVELVGVEVVGVWVWVTVAGGCEVSVWAAAGPARPRRTTAIAARPPRISCFGPCIRFGRSSRLG